MKLSYHIIDPSGNITLIVDTPVPVEYQSSIAKRLMSVYHEVEQVAFTVKPAIEGTDLAIRMMGGEFCGNASLSAASLWMYKAGALQKTLRLEVSGADRPLAVDIKGIGDGVYTGSVEMPLPLSCDKRELMYGGVTYKYPVVSFKGISHIIVEDGITPELAVECIRCWCAFLGADALGIIFRENDSIRPFVYVASTDTAVWESSCASGTCAVAAYEAVRQDRSVSLRLSQEGGVLGAEAEYNGGLKAISLKNTARIIGHFCADT